MSDESEKAIGVFDSGIGGLTVLHAIEKALPSENLLYLGDTARVPYGNKSRETIIRYSFENTHYLIQSGVKAIVVACNTASALALTELQKEFKLPIIGVIEPGARAATKATQSKKVGIIGTEATISSLSYFKAIREINHTIQIWGVACPLFVPLVEEGWLTGDIPEQVAKRYLEPFLKTPIDTLILGCTHYPLLKKTIDGVLGEKVRLVDSAFETAQTLKELLHTQKLERNASGRREISYFVTDSPERFKKVGRNFLDRTLEEVTLVGV